jgi:dihydrofolate reductase
MVRNRLVLVEADMKIVVMNNVTLDGVMQAPGRADEDTRGGFAHGGWASQNIDQPDPEIGAAMGVRMSQSDGLLLGRRTYEDLLSTWNSRGGMFKDALNAARKYVVSQTLTDPLPWPNSTLVSGNVVDAVAELRSRPGRELHIMGSGQLIETLVAHQLVDEFLLLIFPVVLGSGRHLFSGDTYMELDLVDAKATGSGVVIATFRRKVRAEVKRGNP